MENFVSRDTVVGALNWRYATKAFDPARKISAPDWQALEQALMLSPSAYGLQPWKFLVITNQTLKDQLVAASGGQRQVADCSHLVIFTHKRDIDLAFVDSFLQRAAEVRGVGIESLAAYRQMIATSLLQGSESQQLGSWSRRQTFIALGNFLTCAALMGIDACPMEGIALAEYDRILRLEHSDYTTCAACPVGYRHASDKYAALAKVRFDVGDVIQHI